MPDAASGVVFGDGVAFLRCTVGLSRLRGGPVSRSCVLDGAYWLGCCYPPIRPPMVSLFVILDVLVDYRCGVD